MLIENILAPGGPQNDNNCIFGSIVFTLYIWVPTKNTLVKICLAKKNVLLKKFLWHMEVSNFHVLGCVDAESEGIIFHKLKLLFKIILGIVT